MSAAGGLDYFRRCEALKARDAAACAACGHLSVSHGSHDATEFVGIGAGPCGTASCRCGQFAGSGA